MVIVKCVNLNCSAPHRKFEWDESEHVEAGGGIAQPHEAGAVRVIAVCPFCASENAVWVKNVNKPDAVLRNVRL